MDNVRAGIIEACVELGSTHEHAAHAVEAIMTSDTRPKQIAVEFKLGGKTVRIGGICKGAGMIQPGMSATGARPALPLHATMLCFITTDAAIDAKSFAGGFAGSRRAEFQSHHRGWRHEHERHGAGAGEWVGGKSKTSEHSEHRNSSQRLEFFRPRLNHVCLELAKMIVRDGEGVHRVVTVRVNGAKTVADADAAARAVANSPLVKTSWHGGDPNWGRIIDALGYSPAKIVEEKVDIGYSCDSPRLRQKRFGAARKFCGV